MYGLKNSSEFVAFITEHTLRSDEILVSFNVTSLFTNVPISLTVAVARKWLLHDDTSDERTALEVEGIVTLLKLCLDATYICFRGKHYQQTFVINVMSRTL